MGKIHRPPRALPEALDAPRLAHQSAEFGRIAYYKREPTAASEARPLLLIHSINAAPSSFEVKPIFERCGDRRRVFSIDLPGFGHSERSDRRYSPELFAGAIAELLERVVGEPADVLALSLSGEFAARAALMVPRRFASLALISPSGFSKRPLPSPKVGRIAYGALSVPLWGRGLFDLVASKRSIRYFLGQSFSASAPEELIEYAYATAHQPGAHHAPLYFLSMQLFTAQAQEQLYDKLPELPILAIADRDPYITFERLPEFAAARANWHYQSLAPHMGLPHWERPEATLAALEQFWSSSGC
jgi:pimeloyl-ACP methyl ester carboxylesterase